MLADADHQKFFPTWFLFREFWTSCDPMQKSWQWFICTCSLFSVLFKIKSCNSTYSKRRGWKKEREKGHNQLTTLTFLVFGGLRCHVNSSCCHRDGTAPDQHKQQIIITAKPPFSKILALHSHSKRDDQWLWLLPRMQGFWRKYNNVFSTCPLPPPPFFFSKWRSACAH